VFPFCFVKCDDWHHASSFLDQNSLSFTVVGYTVGAQRIFHQSSPHDIDFVETFNGKTFRSSAGYYEPNGAAIMQFYLLNAEGTIFYMKGDVANSYNHLEVGNHGANSEFENQKNRRFLFK